jgi:putative hydrolase of the HAD superfamily
MNPFQHYSFDLWMTLIRSDPAFKRERTRFFYDNFNYRNRSIEEITAVFRRVDLLADTDNEKTGKHIESERLHGMVITAMNDDDDGALEGIDLGNLYQEMEGLLLKHPPVFFDDDTPMVLDRLKIEAGGQSSFSLLSNTAFIKGRILRKVLDGLGLAGFFDFQLYSDEEGLSKPNKQLFGRMLEKIALQRKDAGKRAIGLTEIVHIGDNEKADIGGANAVGISSLLINSNGKGIICLLEQSTGYDNDLFLT